MLEDTEGTIKKGQQSRGTGNIVYTRRRQTKDNIICVGHHYMQTNPLKDYLIWYTIKLDIYVLSLYNFGCIRLNYHIQRHARL
jgi:hypothetical protein